MTSQNIVAIFVGQEELQQELQNGLGSKGLEAVAITNSDQLHHLMNHQRVDALLVEQELSGFLTGLDILDRLKQQLLRPVTMLLGKLSHEQRKRAEELEINFITDRETGIDNICQTIKTALSKASDNIVRIPFAARKLVQESDFIRPMPQLVVRLAYYLGDDRATTAEMAKDISADPKITADLLRTINSSAFGLRNHIVKVADAVTVLGMRRTACLIMMSAIQKMHTGLEKALPEDLLRWHRTRSLVTASSASAFAKLGDNISKDHAYTLGLLQDLGILVLAHQHKNTYVRIIERVRTIALLQLEACERHEFSLTHGEVSAALLQKWQLPASMVGLVLDHHKDEGQQEHSKLDARFLQLMRIGEAVANMSDVPSSQRNSVLQPLLKNFSKATANDIRGCLADAISTASSMGQLFNIPVPEGQRWDELVTNIRDELRRPDPAAAPLVAAG